MSYQVIFNDSLYHHGILGQRWGIRRFRNKDGSLTYAGKRRYQDDKPKKKSYHRVTLERRYMDSGMSKEDAEREADKKIKMEKGIAIAAGATALTMIIFDKSKLNMTPPKNVSRLDLKDIKKAKETELGKAYLKLFAESFAVGGVVGGVSNYKNYDDKVIEKYKNKEATK